MGDLPSWFPRRGVVLLSFLAAAAFTTGREISLAGRIGLPLDDSWIHAALARSLADGSLADQATFQIRLHPSEPPVAASTAPLWTFLESLAMRLTLAAGEPGDPDGSAAVAAAKALGILFGAAACLLAARLARKITGSAWIGVVAGTLLSIQSRFLWGALSGLEVPLFVSLALAGVLAHLEWRSRSGWRRYAPIALFSLAGFARPECFLLVPIHLLDVICFGGPEDRRAGSLAKRALAAAVFVAPYPALHLVLSGRPLPTTFYVKGEAGSVFAKVASEGLSSVPAFFAADLLDLGIWLLAFLPALFLPLLPGFVRGCKNLLRRGSGGASILPLALLAFPVLHALLGTTDPTQQSGRRLFVLPVFFLVTASAGLATQPVRPLPRKGARWALLAGATACLGVAAWALLPLPLEQVLPDLRYFYSDLWGGITPDVLERARPNLLRVRDGIAVLHLGALFTLFGSPRVPGLGARKVLIAAAAAQTLVALAGAAGYYAKNVRDTDRLNVALARWVAENLPLDAKVAVHDLGAMAYFGRHRLVDLEGIGSPWVIPYRRRGPLGLLEVVHTARPDFYAGAPGGLSEAYRAPVVAQNLPPVEKLFEQKLPENVTVASDTVVVLRIRW
jgi:hypothetical protein